MRTRIQRTRVHSGTAGKSRILKDWVRSQVLRAMFVPIHELEQRDFPLSLEVRPGEIDFLDENLRQEDSLHIQGSVHLRKSTRELQVKVSLTGRLSFSCDRCLSRVQWPLALDLDLTYLPADASPQEDEREISADEAEIGFYDSKGISLEEVWREQVLLSLPMRRVCQPSCQEEVLPKAASDDLADSRWTALKGFRPARSRGGESLDASRDKH